MAEASASLPKPPEVISLDPQLIGDIIENVRLIGRATGAQQKADQIAESMQTRINAVTARAADADTRPSVLHVEWADPLMCGGHWVPQMVALAGGANAFGHQDTGTLKIQWSEVVERQPEIIIMMPCGFDVKRGLQDIPILAQLDGWKTLPAVQNDRVYVIDASAYTSRSGPRLVTGLEIMAEMIHPELFNNQIPESAALRLFTA